ncbi:hypothetical protein HY772_06065 [Candidatus Woesearchaeota archaeon]|nr:hypothetical protein [Candidatus Woesearchaeota archaeon]
MFDQHRSAALRASSLNQHHAWLVIVILQPTADIPRWGVPPVSITVLVSISRRKAVVLTVLVELFNNAAH